MIFLKMRGGTPQKFLIFCLNNSPDHSERTADAFPVSELDIRNFDSLDRGTFTNLGRQKPRGFLAVIYTASRQARRDSYEDNDDASSVFSDARSAPQKNSNYHFFENYIIF